MRHLKKISSSIYDMIKLFRCILTSKKASYIYLCSLNAVIMLLLVLIFTKLNYFTDDEIFLINCSSGMKRLLFKIDEKPNLKDIIYINTSYDNQLVEYSDDYGTGTVKITDRKKLTKLLQLLNSDSDNYKFVVFDLFFEDKSIYDSVLFSECNRMKNSVFGFRTNSVFSQLYPIDKDKIGYVNINSINNIFLNFELMDNDSVKSLPLKMFEKINNINFTNNGLYLSGGGLSVLNQIVIDYPLRYFDFHNLEIKEKHSLLNLNQLIDSNIFSDRARNNLLKNKILIVGDFSGNNDIHPTIYGDMPGALIMLNIYYNLEYKYNQITTLKIITLFLIFFLFSAYLFSKKRILKNLVKFIPKYPVLTFWLRNIKYYGILFFISLNIFLLFNFHIKILALIIYINIVLIVLRYYENKKTKYAK